MSCELENIIAPRELCDEAHMAQDAWKFYEARGLKPLYSRVVLGKILRDNIPEPLREHLAHADAFVMGHTIVFIEPDWSKFKQERPLSRVAQTVAHEVAHTFIGIRYEPWVYESMAEAMASVYVLRKYGNCYMSFETLWLYDGLYKVNPTSYVSNYVQNYHFASAFFNYLVEHDDWSTDPYSMYMSSLLSLIEGVYRCTELHGVWKMSVIDVPVFMFDYYVEKDKPIVVGYLKPYVAYFVASRHGAVEVSRSDRCTARSVYIGGGLTAAVVVCSDGVTNVEIRSTGRASQRRIKLVTRTMSAEEIGVTCDYVAKRMGRGSVVKAHGYTIYYPVPPDMLVYIAKAVNMPAEITADGACLWDTDFSRLSVAVAMLYADKKRSLRMMQFAVKEININDIAKLLGQLYMTEVDRCIRQRKPHSVCDSVARYVGEMAYRILRYMRKVLPEIDQLFIQLELQ